VPRKTELRECPNLLQLRLSRRGITAPSKLRTEAAIIRNRNYSAEGTCGRQHKGQQGGRSSRNPQHLIGHSPLLVAALISSIGSNYHNKISNSLQEKIRIRTPIKSLVSQCRPKM
jgi:hypothetical protein